MNRMVAAGVAILAVSVVGAATGTRFMARRVSEFNASLPDQFDFKAQTGRDVRAFGHRLTFTDTTTNTPDGPQAAVRVEYGGSAVTIPVIAPKVPDFKDLTTYEDSFTVLSFAPIKEGKTDIKPFSDEHWRAVIVARETRPGFDQDTWGEVRVKDWTWNVYELKPDGTIAPPRTIQYRDRRGALPAEKYARDALKNAGKPVPPMPEQGGPRLTAVEPIQERTWEWQAALFTVPKMHISRYRFRSDAVDGTDLARGMGWTLPLTGFSVLGMVVGCGLIMAGLTKRRSAAVGGPAPAVHA